jgi:hypothetical protein
VLCAPRVPSAIVWSAVVATHVILLLGPPLSLTDLFNYLHSTLPACVTPVGATQAAHQMTGTAPVSSASPA